MTKATGIFLALLGCGLCSFTLRTEGQPAAIRTVAVPLAAQDASVIPLDQEPHHHLALKNDVVEVFNVDLASHDAFKMHRHDHDDVAVVLGEAVTVNTSPGKPDLLQNYKGGEVNFARSPRVHSVRNIGQTDYRIVSIDLLRAQTGARNLCGAQVTTTEKRDCPASAEAAANAPRSDSPQFETDQIRVTLTEIRPHQTATFGEKDVDDLIVPVEDAAVPSGKAKGPDEPLASGTPVWLARGKDKKTLKNNTDKDLRIVTVAFKS